MNLSSQGFVKKVQSRTRGRIILVAYLKYAASSVDAQKCVWNLRGAMALTVPIVGYMPQIKMHLQDEIYEE